MLAEGRSYACISLTMLTAPLTSLPVCIWPRMSTKGYTSSPLTIESASVTLCLPMRSTTSSDAGLSLMENSPGSHGEDEVYCKTTKDIDVSLEGSRFVINPAGHASRTLGMISSRCVLASGQEWVIPIFISCRVWFNRNHLASTSAHSNAVAVSQERLCVTSVNHLLSMPRAPPCSLQISRPFVLIRWTANA